MQECRADGSQRARGERESDQPRIRQHAGDLAGVRRVSASVGDALLALFNAPARQADHARRAVRAALDLQAAVDAIAERESSWPRFRVGANTGPALVGNIGSATLRGFNAMGDAVNVAARLQTLAEPGQVVIGEATLLAVGPGVRVEPLGDLTVKGRQQPVRAFVVTGLAP